MRRATRILSVVVVACAAVVVHAIAAHGTTRIVRQEPTKGTVGSAIHVEGTGCPPPAGTTKAGTFLISNGTGVEFEFEATPEGNFSFDYEVPPAEAGEQHEDSKYETKLFCRSTNRSVTGPRFEITGPVFTLRPDHAPLGAPVRVVGTGCVQDGSGADDAVLLVDGENVRTFKATERFDFDFTFRVPEKLTAERRYVVQIDCLIQRLESAAGEGGQRFIVPALLFATAPAPATVPVRTVPTTARPAPPYEPDTNYLPMILAALGAAIAVAAFVTLARRRLRNRPVEPLHSELLVMSTEEDLLQTSPKPEDGPEPEPEPEAEPSRPTRPAPLRAERVPILSVDTYGVSADNPPYAPQRRHELVAFGDVRVDQYYWLRERDNPEVITYLEAENQYADAVLEPLAELRRELFDAIKARTKEDDTSAPVPLRAWEYYLRTAQGAQYPDSCRRPRGTEAHDDNETVIIDRNAIAEGHDYLSCLGPIVSPNDRLCLYAADFDGSEKYTLGVRDLETLEDLADAIPETAGDMCWITDDVFLYVVLDETHRPFQVRRHVLGDEAADDQTIYEDDDDRFFVGVRRDPAGRFVFVHSESKTSSEDHFLSVEDPLGPLTVVEPRRDGVEYRTDDDGDRFVILTNADGAADFKVVTAPIHAPGRTNWADLLAHRPGTRVTEVSPFKAFLAIGERHDALTTIRIIDRASGQQHAMHHNEAVYVAEIDANPEFDTTVLRFSFTSLNTPMTWIDYDVVTKVPTVVKQQEVLGDFSPSNYVTAREWATAADGVKIPISIMYRKDKAVDGTAPALLYGYGSYEISIDPSFSVARLNLVDRGVVFAIAHVRGGGEMGREWYERGKLLRKRNTFDDFIACARHLVDSGWCAPDKLAARGGSAGGLLMGAVANMAPHLFNTVVAEVPFVDVVTTMSDDTIPLTVTEWEEWGNPRDNADDYQYMKSYSPYDNLAAMDYPAMYVGAGLNDPNVQYWEPAKWVAKLRVTKTDDRPLLLRTEMGAGHGGPSGRYSAWEDEARVQAFILQQLGVDEPRPSRTRSRD
ncbi:MAG TPA: S9 family peptidase [Acidimicrobiales bacterium]|nr:S9 family peptidase [Acidimicrobiales bacterium]